MLDRAWEAYCVPPVAALARVIFAIPYPAIIYGFTVGAKAGGGRVRGARAACARKVPARAETAHPKITQKRAARGTAAAPGCRGKAAGEGGAAGGVFRRRVLGRLVSV